MKTSWFEKYGNWVSSKKGKWITLVVWILILAAVNLTLPQASSQKNDLAANLSSSKPSVEAQKLAEKEFPSGDGKPALLTWYRSSGLTDDDIAGIQKLSKDLADNPLPEQLNSVPIHEMPLPAVKQLISKDGTTLVYPILFDKKASTEKVKASLKELNDRTSDMFDTNPFDAKMKDKDTLLVRATGPAGIEVDAVDLFSQGDLSLLLATVTLVLVFLLVIYRSPILALVPLVAVGFAYGVINPVLGWFGKEGWATFDSQGLSIMTVLLFGAGTDYCLFLIARFRTLLKEERDKKQALKRALTGSSGAIAMSGLTVVFSLLALLLAQYGSIQRFAIPFSLSILIMMVASLTLVPAFLAILGRASFFPFIPRTREMEVERAEKKGKKLKPEKTKPSFGEKLGGGIVRNPWKIAIGTVVVLGVFAFFSMKIQYTFDTLSSFPKDMPSREGFQLISDHFNSGELAPAQVMVQSEGNDLDLKEKLEALPYVAKVSDPRKGEKNKDMLSYDVEFSVNPYSNEAMNHIPDLRDEAEKSLKSAGVSNAGDKVWIGGQTSEQFDTRATTDKDASVVIPIIIAMIAVLLLVYLRSVVAMLYLMATVLLSYFSALGLGWIVLHYGFDVTAIQGFIPLYSFVFIVALGEDYNIFMISSIWKKSKRMPLGQAVTEGVSQSGAVITSAGLILAGTFAVLATLPIQVLVQFGTVTAIGVLLDTFVVRPFLVPALTVIFGRWAFWPSKRNQEAIRQNN
ncbi:MMPL family transporter [Falsibacillus pallidus]|uniref:RND superfamily putative drug exporter n=1 Tax=Falsibacillus pallidus TaxID=493781 RepID=A0A370GFM1_9BACI|nr:MMPL family transporter [Falsibacillus pallidus]RDI41909.1 RND superfamily putative drug exporter [Falsibacillus pallidus]